MTSQSRNKHVLVYTSTDESFQLSTTFEIPKSERPKSEEGERTSSYVRLLPLPGMCTSYIYIYIYVYVYPRLRIIKKGSVAFRLRLYSEGEREGGRDRGGWVGGAGRERKREMRV
jgi:hypothetical protein